MIVIPQELTEDARLALIDLDVTADGIRGKELHWYAEVRKCVPLPMKVSYLELEKKALVAGKIVIFNSDTQERREIQFAPGATVRQVVENSGFIPAWISFVIRSPGGDMVDNLSGKQL